MPFWPMALQRSKAGRMRMTVQTRWACVYPDVARALWRELEINDPSWQLFRDSVSEDDLAARLLASFDPAGGRACTGPADDHAPGVGGLSAQPDLQRAFPYMSWT